MSEPAILAENLIKRYGDLVAVNGITFDVPPNQCFGILGPNGAGKTTTIRMIHCRFAPDGGRLLVLGMDVTKHAREIKARIGLVPQENNLYEDLTLLENVELYGRFFGIKPAVARRRAKELIEFMELGAKMHEPVKALSGGMQRRAVIARALINQPELVVLDEPTTGLDPQARILLWDRLRELKAQGVTLLLTTHYMDEAQRLCDDLILMDYGTILDRGSPAELVERHVGRWVAELEVDREHPLPAAAGVPVSWDGSARAAAAGGLHADGEISLSAAALPPGVRRVERSGRALHLYGDDDKALLAAVQVMQPESYLIRPANLEDVFLTRTGRGIRE